MGFLISFRRQMAHKQVLPGLVLTECKVRRNERKGKKVLPWEKYKRVRIN